MKTICKKCGLRGGLTMGVICGNCGESPNKDMKLVFTKNLPTGEGYYYWTNFGENTPCVLQVKMDWSTKTLWAMNEEYCFEIKSPDRQQVLDLPEHLDPDIPKEGKYSYGDELWCRIPNPFLPSGEKQVKPYCY